MLKRLLIQNFAIIDDIEIEFHDGMTVLTGETGAGKSIIIDAIGLLTGNRATANMVSAKAKKALIEGSFDISALADLKQTLADMGFEDDDELVLSREITSAGKSTCRINFRSVPLSVLRKVAMNLCDIHSQFATQYLLNEKIHLTLLDRYIGADLSPAMADYKQSYEAYLQARKNYETLLKTPGDEEDLAFYQARVDEISEADLREGELEELENEKKRMAGYEKTVALLQSAKSALDDQALDSVYEAQRILARVNDPEMDELSEKIQDCYYSLVDYASQISAYEEGLTYDPYRLEEIQNRIFLIRKLQRQYGYEISDILAQKQELEEKIAVIVHRDELLEKLQKDYQEAQSIAFQKAQKLSLLRHEAGEKLEKLVARNCQDLYMPDIRFALEFTSSENLQPEGIDQVRFLLSTNAGQDLRPLSAVASGGELSRLMLALKCIFAKSANVATIIFDEADSGVSGKVAFATGRKMKELSKDVQVLCITHLPQVASFARWHIEVYKTNQDGYTITETRYLNDGQRVEEIAKMLSNDTVSQPSLENARVLLEESARL